MRHLHEMIKTSAFFLVPCLGLLTGCGGSAGPTVGSEIAPKFGGTIISLPSGKGVVEFGIEAIGPGQAKNKKSQVFAFYMKPDGAPMDPVPSDVSFTSEGGTSLSLKADAGKPGRFVSDPGTPLAAGREVSGELAATVGGESQSVTVIAR